jgi:xanthine dehydrogenase accessory factor
MRQPLFPTVLIRGAGDLASGTAWRLFRCGFPVIMLELPQPLVIRRAVAFATCVYDGECEVEGVRAQLIDKPTARRTLDYIPVLIDAEASSLKIIQPAIIVDARMAKNKLDTCLEQAPLVIGLGPGYEAGRDCHRVVETQRGQFLGRVVESGFAQPDSGVPGTVGGENAKRILRAPADGVFESALDLGALVRTGDVVGRVGSDEIVAELDGMLRGLLRPATPVTAGLKVGDIDPRPSGSIDLRTISDKSRAVAGGVLEAILSTWRITPPP